MIRSNELIWVMVEIVELHVVCFGITIFGDEP